MADKPILFSGPMVRALLDGRKTQTRRVVKQQPKLAPHHEPVRVEPRGNRGWVWMVHTDRPTYQFATGDWRAPYAVGDRLYVREAYRFPDTLDAVPPRDVFGSWVFYEADQTDAAMGGLRSGGDEYGRFRQGMHMPRWASRLTLTVTDVRVQRLQEISEADAIAEGMPSDNWNEKAEFAGYFSPVEAFMALWDSLNAERGFGWNANPWVVAISFQVHRQNIDVMRAAA